MTRKEFILFFLNRKIKPLLYIAILFYSIYFFIQVITNKNGIERNILILILFSIVILLLLGTTQLLVNYLKNKIPEKIKPFFKIVSTITEVFSAILLIGFIVNSWKENKIFEFIVMLGLLIFLIYTKKSKSIQ